MAKVSVIIPASNEIYLQRTITDLLTKATGEIEVIAVLDGYWPDKVLESDPRLIVAHRPKGGMRASINAGIDISTGKYLMKLDAHCSVAPGFDEALQADFRDHWLVIPRRYSMEMETGGIRFYKPIVDYEYLANPDSPRLNKSGKHLRGWKWDERTKARANRLIDETMTFQGSCWFVNKEEFMQRVGHLNDKAYGPFSCEAQEIGLQYWLGDGKCMVNKKTWYAHLWKGEGYRKKYFELYGKKYARTSPTQLKKSIAYSLDYWMNNRWEERRHDLEWLIKRFAPVPSW